MRERKAKQWHSRREYDYVIAHFDQIEILKAKARLCETCKRYDNCLLLPITTKGEDCPYRKDSNVLESPTETSFTI